MTIWLHENWGLSIQFYRDAKLSGTLSSSVKLAPTLLDRKNYVVHIRNLQFYIRQGAVITRVSRAISFNERCWLAPYINANTEQRKRARDDLEKAFWKLLNNSLFGKLHLLSADDTFFLTHSSVLGKTIESVRKRSRIVLVNKARSATRIASKPEYKRFKILSDTLVAVEARKTRMVFDKPIYVSCVTDSLFVSCLFATNSLFVYKPLQFQVGFSVLDLSKLLMFEFHYNVMVPHFGSPRLCFTDTDSFLYQLHTKDLYGTQIPALKRHMDLSNYPRDHPLFSEKNKAIIGLFKDETEGKPIGEFVGLRSKMYSVLVQDGKRKMAAAGVPRALAARDLTHGRYLEALRSTGEYSMSINQTMIRSKAHTIHTVTSSKRALSRYDDKRFVLNDGVSTRPHGHWKNNGFTIENIL